MGLPEQINNNIAMQAVVTPQATLTAQSVPLRITLFDANGNPINLGGTSQNIGTAVEDYFAQPGNALFDSEGKLLSNRAPAVLLKKGAERDASYYGITTDNGSTADNSRWSDAMNDMPVGGTLVLPPSRVSRLTSGVVRTAPIAIKGQGSKIIPDFDGNVFNFSSPYGPTTVVTTITQTSKTEVGGATGPTHVLTLASAQDWKPGDYIKIASDDVIPEARPGDVTVASRLGEFAVVKSVSGTSVVLKGLLRETYTTNVRAALINVERSVLSDLIFESPNFDTSAYTNALVVFSRMMRPKVENMLVRGAPATALMMQSCLNYDVDLNVMFARNSPNDGQYGYGLNDISSSLGRAHILFGYGRHAFTDDTNRIAANSSDITKNGRSFGARVTGDAVGTSAQSWDTHAAGEGHIFDVTARNSSSAIAVQLRGKNHEVSVTATRMRGALAVFEESAGGFTYGIRAHKVIARDCSEAAIKVVLAPTGHPTGAGTRRTDHVALTVRGDCYAVGTPRLLDVTNAIVDVDATIRAMPVQPTDYPELILNTNSVIRGNFKFDLTKNTTNEPRPFNTATGAPTPCVFDIGTLHVEASADSATRVVDVFTGPSSVQLSLRSGRLSHRFAGQVLGTYDHANSRVSYTIDNSDVHSGYLFKSTSAFGGANSLPELASIADTIVLCQVNPGGVTTALGGLTAGKRRGQLLQIVLTATGSLAITPSNANRIATSSGQAVTLTGKGAGIELFWDTSDGNNPVWRELPNSGVDSKINKGSIVINVKDYGAVGDGVTDDTTAIVAAKDAAVAKGVQAILEFPASSGAGYYTTSTITIPGGVLPWMNVPIIYGGTDSAALVYGAAVGGLGATRAVEGFGRIKVRRATQGDWTSANEIGALLQNLYYCNLFVDEAVGFTVGVENRGDGGGFSYNKIYFGRIQNNKYGHRLAAYNLGWVNENSFYGGSWSCNSNVWSAAGASKDRYGVHLALGDSTYLNNNSNTWYKPSFEIGGETSTEFEGVPILIDASSVGNRFLDIRNEKSEEIVCRTTGTAYPPYVSTAYDSLAVNLRFEELGSRAGTVLERSQFQAEDAAKRFVFATGALHKTACYYDGDTSLHLPGLAVRTSATTLTESRAGSGFTLGSSTLTIPTSRAVVRYVSTRVMKRFTLIADQDGGGGRFMVSCYDSSGAAITTGTPIRTAKSTPTFQTSFGGNWTTGNDSLGQPWHFTVADNVDYIAVGVRGGSAAAVIRNWAMFALDNNATPATWLPWQDNGDNYATTAPTVGTWEVGRRILNATPTTNGPAGWICTASGTPGTWRTFGEPSSTTPPQIDIFTAGGTWTKPSGAKLVTVKLVGGGLGGASGRRGAPGTVRCGGGGGAGGAWAVNTFDAADLPSTVTVAVGAGGAGGAAVTTDDTNGNAGSMGGGTSFGALLIGATSSGVSVGGTNALGTGATAANGMFSGCAGGTASTTGGVGVTGGTNPGAGGGGSGGGITTANVASAGGTGSPSRSINGSTVAGGVVDGAAPSQGVAPSVKGSPSAGGGGGASSVTAAAQAGATPLGYGGGGGGGGASTNGFNSGAGAAGAPGYAIVITTF